MAVHAIPSQPELNLRPDDREAHEVYLRSPPLRYGQPRHPLYWPGLIVELREAYPTDKPLPLPGR